MDSANNVNVFLNILYLVITLGVVIGGLVAFRISVHRTNSELHKTAGEIQERVITALQGEIDSLKDRIDELEKENIKLRQTLGLIKKALSKRGLTITIEGDLVSISDAQGSSVHTQRITGQMEGET